MSAERATDRPADTLRSDFTHLIDGELVAGAGEIEVVNPASGAVFARCPAAGRSELDRAVAAARRAFDAWRAASFESRRAAIRQLAQVLREHQSPLAELLTLEQGKPIGQARDEITRAATQSDNDAGGMGFFTLC